MYNAYTYSMSRLEFEVCARNQRLTNHMYVHTSYIQLEVKGGVSMAPYVSIRQHTPAYVSIRQHTSAPGVGGGVSMAPYVSICQHTSAYVSIRQHLG